MDHDRTHALELTRDLSLTAANLQRVSRGTDLAAWAFAQWELRRRALAKFAQARAMIFESEALEMATHERIAAYHASKFPAGVRVADLTCGIGADLIALARRGPAIGYEIDPERAECARHNLQVHDVRAEVVVGSASGNESYDYLFCDPSRRSATGRTLDLAQFSPDPREIARQFQDAKLLGIKLSPMLRDRDLAEFGGRLEFISFGRECREALVWIGLPADRVAVQIETGAILTPRGDPPRAESPSRYLLEADPAAIRAHCLGSFGIPGLGDSNGYLTSDEPVDSPWLRSFEVLACHPADRKRTRAELRRLGGGTPVVKVRGTQVDVAQLQRDLAGPGEALCLIVFPVGRSLRHAICRPIG